MGHQRSTPSVAIIGAGLNGIGLAVRLKKAGLNDFALFEKSAGPGGVWFDNRYPGVGVDIPSALYSYSFKQSVDHWRRTHATGAELRDYIQEVIDDHRISGHLNFGCEVRALRWREWDQQWEIEFAEGESKQFDIVVPAVGMLNVPKYPDIPGLDEFEGPVFHTARWPEGLDLVGKRVAYVGTGSTAVQAIPELTRDVAELHVFQREPGWILPKDDSEIEDAYRARARKRPWLMWRDRWRVYRRFEALGAVAHVGSPEARRYEGVAREYLKIVEDPAVRAALTPEYPILCKRMLTAGPDYLQAFNEPAVTLVPHAVQKLTANGIVAADGVERPVDVVVLSTGFHATDFLSTIEVTGRRGRRLHDVWASAGGAHAYLGMAVDGFPNLLMLYGPNSNVVTSIIFVGECQAAFIVRVLKRMSRTSIGIVSLRAFAGEIYQRWIERALREHPSAIGGCNNYQSNAEGKIITIFPFRATVFWLLTRLSGRIAFKGHITQRRSEKAADREAGGGAPGPGVLLRDRESAGG